MKKLQKEQWIHIVALYTGYITETIKHTTSKAPLRDMFNHYTLSNLEGECRK